MTVTVGANGADGPLAAMGAYGADSLPGDDGDPSEDGTAGDSDSRPAPLPKRWSFVPLNPFFIGENAGVTFASGAKAKMTIPRIYGPHPILIARELGMMVPTGSTVMLVISSKSKSVCKLSPIGHLNSSKKGTCTVTVTVTPKRGQGLEQIRVLHDCLTAAGTPAKRVERPRIGP